MVDRHTSPYGNSCEVTLDLPWDVAEHLVKFGPAILKAVCQALEARRRDVQTNEHFRRLSEQDGRRHRKEWTSLARVADRELRQRLRTGIETRNQILRSIALKYGVDVGFIHPLVSNYRRERRAILRERRRALIIRLYFSGLSNAEIAAQLRPRISAAQVSKIIRAERNLIRALIQTNSSLQRAMAGTSGHRQTRRAVKLAAKERRRD